MQLRSSAEGFAWAVRQVPAGMLHSVPPPPLGEWPAARHVYHMLHYERTIALPSTRQWLGGQMPDLSGDDEVAAWGTGHDVEEGLAAFRAVMEEQVALLSGIDAGLWEERRGTVWGELSLRWVVAKTYQHTCEHIHDVLSMALRWEMAAAHSTHP
jgi:hypothetical protein